MTFLLKDLSKFELDILSMVLRQTIFGEEIQDKELLAMGNLKFINFIPTLEASLDHSRWDSPLQVVIGSGVDVNEYLSNWPNLNIIIRFPADNKEGVIRKGFDGWLIYPDEYEKIYTIKDQDAVFAYAKDPTYKSKFYPLYLLLPLENKKSPAFYRPVFMDGGFYLFDGIVGKDLIPVFIEKPKQLSRGGAGGQTIPDDEGTVAVLNQDLEIIETIENTSERRIVYDRPDLARQYIENLFA